MRQGFVFSVIAWVILCAPVWAVNGDMGVGTDPNTDGSETYPWLIEDINDFDEFAGNSAYWASGVYTRLETDIDLDPNLPGRQVYTTAVIAPDTDNTNNYWVFDGPPFTGVFEGNNFVISNLTIDGAAIGNHFLGLFGFVDSAGEIRNLAIENVDVDGNKYIGGIVGRLYGTITNCHTSGILNAVFCGGGVVGYNDSGMIDNCDSSALIFADDTAGGLVGDNSGTITNCSSTGSVTTTNYGFAGGLAGESYGSVINCYATGDVIVPDGHGGGLIGYSTDSVINCYATGSVSGNRDSGGLAGQNRGTISFCYSTGSVISTGYNIGGLVGSNDMGTIQNCFSLGDVTGDDKVGGFVGYNAYIIEKSYCTGRIIGNTYVGGICGYQNGSFPVISNCFWDTETSGISTGYNLDPTYPGTITNVLGKTTTEMMTQSTFTDAGWDFTDTWFMSGYPALSWQADFGGGDGSESNPYLIENMYDFDKFSSDPNYWAAGVHTKLMTDIDLAGRTYTTAVIAPDTDSSNNPWDFDGDTFAGVFDGNNFAVINLTIDTAGMSNDYLGLFGKSSIGEGVEIKNLGIENMTITGGNDSEYVGGLMGELYHGIVTNCYSTGNISCNGHVVGGLIGIIKRSSSVSNCYSASTVAGGVSVGGLVGFNDGDVSNCYSTGVVIGDYEVGGLLGWNWSNGDASNCYSTSSVSGNSNIGGFCGVMHSLANGSFNNSFWNVECSGTTIAYNLQSGSFPDYISTPIYGTPGVVEGKTTIEMMTQSTFSGWDFTTPVWRMLRSGEDYPRLAWQEVFDGDIAGLYGVDMVDYARLAGQWNEPVCNDTNEWCQGADIDHLDGVDIKDLAAIAEDWLKR